MAIDLRVAAKMPYMHVKTSLPSLTITEIKLPPECNQVTIGSLTHQINVYQNDVADNDTVATLPAEAGYMFIPLGNVMSIRVGRGSTRATSIYIAAASGTPTVSLMIEEY
jgi:hypothetical protein